MALTVGLVLAGACVDNPIVAPENSPTTDALTGALTTAGVKTLALGVLAQDRALVREGAFSIIPLIYARDAYRIDPNEPRWVNETLGAVDPGSFAGNAAWTNGFVTIRSATSLLEGLPGAVATQISAGQRNTTAGLIQTVKALEYYRLLELRDSLGVPIQAADPATVAPISCKAKVLDYIASQLDSANTALIAAGSGTLPFTPPTGFTAYGRNYASAANLILLNRGLKGKVDLYRGLQHTTPTAGAFTAAIAELTQALGGAAPGGVSAASFQNGAYVTFVAGGTENAQNPLSDARVGANPKAQAGLQAGDTRASKFITRSTISGFGVTTSENYVGSSTANTANLTRPLAILRDEEVVLLRAQAYFENNQFVQGLADLNSVRTNYGLGALTLADVPTLAAARQAVLYEKHYSLFFEGPQRLVDLRAYGLLKAGTTPQEIPGDAYNNAMPIPKNESDARGGRDKLTPVCS
jgi:hypothetical protein